MERSTETPCAATTSAAPSRRPRTGRSQRPAPTPSRHCSGRTRPHPDAMLGDKAYSSRANRLLLRIRGIKPSFGNRLTPQTPRSRSGRPVNFDAQTYKAATPSKGPSDSSNNGAATSPLRQTHSDLPCRRRPLRGGHLATPVGRHALADTPFSLDCSRLQPAPYIVCQPSD